VELAWFDDEYLSVEGGAAGGVVVFSGDHAPVFYAVHLWNLYQESLGRAAA
jgi:hypothetical protein